MADDAAGTFVPITPTRVLDTRTGLGAAAAKVSAHTALRVQVGGVAGVPETGVAAVVLNVTVPAPARKGYVTVYPASDDRPVASNLNVAAGETLAGLAVAKLGLNGGVAIYNGTGAASHLVADVSGYYLDGEGSDPGTFVPLSPSRVLDTRNGTGAPRGDVAARGSVELVIAGHGGVPETGVAAVALGVTDVRPEHGGYVTAYPTGGDRPGTSTLNAPAGHTVANLAIVPLGDGGTVTLHNGSAGTTNLVADVFGYVLEGETIARGGYVPVAPTRILDTRRPTAAAGGIVPRARRGHRPGHGRHPGPRRPGRGRRRQPHRDPLDAAPATSPRMPRSGRAVSALNFRAGRTVANLAVVPLDRLTGSFRLYNGSSGETHLVADIAGYVLGPQPTTLTWTDEGIVHPIGGYNLRSVSCPTADFCAAVDSVGKVVFFDGSDWSWPADSDKAGAVGMDRTIACSAADRCVVVDIKGRMTVFDGTTWTTPAHLSPTGTPLTQAACAPGGRCVAVDGDDNAYVLNDSTWSAALPVGLTGVTDLACPADDACIAVAYDGTVAQYDGVGWSAPATDLGTVRGDVDLLPEPRVLRDHRHEPVHLDRSDGLDPGSRCPRRRRLRRPGLHRPRRVHPHRRPLLDDVGSRRRRLGDVRRQRRHRPRQHDLARPTSPVPAWTSAPSPRRAAWSPSAAAASGRTPSRSTASTPSWMSRAPRRTTVWASTGTAMCSSGATTHGRPRSTFRVGPPRPWTARRTPSA